MGHMKKLVGLTVLAASFALVVLGFGASTASAEQPIVGLWLITVKDSGGNLVDSIFSIWTSDGLESDQDIAPILTGYVCYGTWITIGGRTYGLTHPFFSFQDINSNGEGTETTEGMWDGTSGYSSAPVFQRIAHQAELAATAAVASRNRFDERRQSIWRGQVHSMKRSTSWDI